MGIILNKPNQSAIKSLTNPDLKSSNRKFSTVQYRECIVSRSIADLAENTRYKESCEIVCRQIHIMSQNNDRKSSYIANMGPLQKLTHITVASLLKLLKKGVPFIHLLVLTRAR